MPAIAEKRIVRKGGLLLLDPFRVKPFAGQPRKRFRNIPQLAASIKAMGQITPIGVTLLRGDPDFDAELLDGERRLKACQKLNRRITAVEKRLDGQDRFALSVAANFCRQSHDSLEICEAIERLEESGKSIDEISRIFGKSKVWCYQHKSLAALAPEVKKMLLPAEGPGKKHRGGRLSFPNAILMAQLEPARQVRVAKKIRDKGLGSSETRRLIVGDARASGRHLGKKLSPTSHFERIRRLVKNLREPVAGYLDAPREEFQSLIASMTRGQRKEIREGIDLLTDELLMFSEALAK